MRRLQDIIELADFVLDRKTSVTAAESRVGRIVKPGALARVESSDPALTDVVFELYQGRLDGVQASFATALQVPWSALEHALGEPREGALILDAWSGPIPYEWDRHAPGGGGLVILDVVDEGPTALIHRLLVRRG